MAQYRKSIINMNYYNNIVETIGNTPLVKLNNVTKGIRGTVLAKVEYFNPGNSVKDRIAIRMIEDAEKRGELKPGGTIIEGTSGNTGFGLALTAIAKGYKCIFTMADKQSKEKIDILRAVGAEVVVCPTNVAPDDPRSYYSVAKKLHRDIPNSIYPNQYDNLSNTAAHYDTTGPEIWRDTDGRITHFAASVGTGGTISGTSRYLKEQNPDVQIVGCQPTDGSSIPGIRKWPTEYLPRIFEPQRVDRVIEVSADDATDITRKLASVEGVFAGMSSGGCVWAALKLAQELESGVIVCIICDRGDRYLSSGLFG